MAKNPCSKCGGIGYIPSLAHVDGGRCWKCGLGTNDIVYYTEAEREANKAAQLAARAERRAARVAAREA